MFIHETSKWSNVRSCSPLYRCTCPLYVCTLNALSASPMSLTGESNTRKTPDTQSPCQVAVAFTKRDPIRTHARDELGIDVDELANPLQVLTATARAQHVCLLSALRPHPGVLLGGPLLLRARFACSQCALRKVGACPSRSYVCLRTTACLFGQDEGKQLPVKQSMPS